MTSTIEETATITLTNYNEEIFNFPSKTKAIAWLYEVTGKIVTLDDQHNLVYVGLVNIWGTWKIEDKK